jgi:tetratricopeptide (TPR) repeat protein
MFNMKKILSVTMLMLMWAVGYSQGLTGPPSGDNQKASVIQWIGPVSVQINYSSPDVHAPNGDDRKGKIWGEVAHYGFIDQGFGPSKAAPWRAGANENTTITFSHDVTISGKTLKAGTYGLFLDVEKEGPWRWIFSNNSESWGSYFYNESEDALRVEATPVDSEYTEWLTFGFDDRQPASAVAYLQWENKRIPFKVEVPNVNDLYVGLMRDQLRGEVGFDYRNLAAAAQFCAQNKVNLEEGLKWADLAISMPFIGKAEFSTLRTKAMVLNAMGNTSEADAVMTRAINHPTASVMEIHSYGRSLLQEGKKEKALEVFKLNRQKNPSDTFTTYVGLARGFTAVGDKKNAIKNWELAIKNLPPDQQQNKKFYDDELQKLKS